MLEYHFLILEVRTDRQLPIGFPTDNVQRIGYRARVCGDIQWPSGSGLFNGVRLPDEFEICGFFETNQPILLLLKD